MMNGCQNSSTQSDVLDKLCGVFKDDEMKTDAEKKLKPRRPRKVIKKSHMEDSYPTYLQVCVHFCLTFMLVTV